MKREKKTKIIAAHYLFIYKGCLFLCAGAAFGRPEVSFVFLLFKARLCQQTARLDSFTGEHMFSIKVKVKC